MNNNTIFLAPAFFTGVTRKAFLWRGILVLAAGLDGIENRMVLSAPVNKNLFDPSMAEGLGLETLPTSLEEAVQAAEESEFLRRVLPEQLASRYFTEELKRCEALKHASDPVEYERTHYFNAI